MTFKKSILFLFVALLSCNFVQAQNEEVEAAAEKFKKLLYHLDMIYVDTVDIHRLTEIAIEEMLEELDPHSVYYSAEELKKSNEPLDGSFQGIGVQFNILKDTIMVVRSIVGGPSEKLGIRAGDKIIEIEGEVVAGVGFKNSDVAKSLKGPKGTTVNVGIKRKGSKELLPFAITRDIIPIYSIDASFMVDDKIGYIKVSQFAKKTAEEMRKSIIELKEQGMEELILDLQGNGGGYLRTAIDMCDELLSDDKLIVYTEGTHFSKKETNAYRKGLFESGKLIVLVDQSSASASEILAGAVQDWDRGVIIGRRSFGKGLVQRPIELQDGSAVRLTVQNYYTPAGRCIQKPYDDGTQAYFLEKYERYENGELFSAEDIEFPDSLKFQTLLNKRTVYGGGGIMPDIFVPIDTTQSSNYFSDLIRKGITNTYALNYVDANRDELKKKYITAEDFIKNFQMDDSLLEELLALAAKEEIEFNEADYAISKNAIQIRTKALIARNLFDLSTFYKVINDLNPSYLKAVEVLKNGEFDKMDIAHRQYK